MQAFTKKWEEAKLHAANWKPPVDEKPSAVLVKKSRGWILFAILGLAGSLAVLALSYEVRGDCLSPLSSHWLVESDEERNCGAKYSGQFRASETEDETRIRCAAEGVDFKPMVRKYIAVYLF